MINDGNYYKNFINSFDYPTTIAPDLNRSNIEYRYYSHNLNGNIVELANKFDISKNDLILGIFLFNLTKFSFSKDILVAYKKVAAGYHFNTDYSVKEYIDDFKLSFEDNDYDLSNDEKIEFECEILFNDSDYEKKIINLYFLLMKIL